MSAVFVMIRLLAPYLAAAAIAGGFYWWAYDAGKQSVQAKWDEREIKLKLESSAIKLIALEREKKLADLAKRQTQHIEEQARVTHQINSALADRNRELLKLRMRADAQRTGCRPAGLPAHSGTVARVDDAADTGALILGENEGLAIIAAAGEADRLVTSLVACRADLANLQLLNKQ